MDKNRSEKLQSAISVVLYFKFDIFVKITLTGVNHIVSLDEKNNRLSRYCF